MAQILKEETRRAILDAALQIFAEKGYRHASIGDVAKLAAISPGNIYRYYADKKQLYDAAVPDSLLQKLTALLDKKIASLNGVPLSAAVRAQNHFRNELVALLVENRLYWVVLLRERAGDALAESLTLFWKRWVAALPMPDAAKEAILCDERLTSIRIFYTNLIRLMRDHILTFSKSEKLAAFLEDTLNYHLAGLNALFGSWGKEEADKSAPGRTPQE